MSSPPFNYIGYLRQQFEAMEPNTESVSIQLLIPSKAVVEMGAVDTAFWPELARAYAAFPPDKPSTPQRMSPTFLRALADLIERAHNDEDKAQGRDREAQPEEAQSSANITPQMLDQLDQMTGSGAPVQHGQRMDGLESHPNPGFTPAHVASAPRDTPFAPTPNPGLASFTHEQASNVGHGTTGPPGYPPYWQPNQFAIPSPAQTMASTRSSRSYNTPSRFDRASASPSTPGPRLQPAQPLWPTSRTASAHSSGVSSPRPERMVPSGSGGGSRPVDDPFQRLGQSSTSGLGSGRANGPRPVGLGPGQAINRAASFGQVVGRRRMGSLPTPRPTGGNNSNNTTSNNTTSNNTTSNNNEDDDMNNLLLDLRSVHRD